MIRKLALGILGLFLLLIGYVYWAYAPQLPAATGYAAKYACSAYYLSNRSIESVQESDLGFNILKYVDIRHDERKQMVSADIFGLAERIAINNEDCGCILLPPGTKKFSFPSCKRSASVNKSLDRLKVNLDKNSALSRAINEAFSDKLNETRAVVVMRGDSIVGEQYASGFDQNTSFVGWSMTKSITATLVGMLVKQGVISLEDRSLFSEWSDDPRRQISLDDMLKMQSGLAWEEVYEDLSDATKMLFLEADIVDFLDDSQLESEPGTSWEYSSGTTNLIMGYLEQSIGTKALQSLVYDSLFTRLDMSSAVIETDASDNLVGSSFGYATARDWAKFGQLYNNLGYYNGHQIIDTSWVAYVNKIAASSDGQYGGHFWLNHGPDRMVDVPDDYYSANGFQGQRIGIIPSKDLVIVRLGFDADERFDFNKFTSSIIAALD